VTQLKVSQLDLHAPRCTCLPLPVEHTFRIDNLGLLAEGSQVAAECDNPVFRFYGCAADTLSVHVGESSQTRIYEKHQS